MPTLAPTLSMSSTVKLSMLMKYQYDNVTDETTINGSLSTSNYSEERFFQAVYLGYLWTALIIGLPGNVLIAIVYIVVKQKRTSDWFIFFLSVYDCAVCVFAVPLYLSIETGAWMITGSDLACKIEQFTIFSAQFSSVSMLGIIAVDRYLKICHPTKRSLNATQARNLGMCTPLVSAIVAAPVLVWDGNVDRRYCRIQEQYKRTIGVKVHLCLTFGFFVCMFFLVIFCYSNVCVVVRRRIQRHKENALKRKHLMQIPAFLQAISNVDDLHGLSSSENNRNKKRFSLFSIGSSRRLSAISPWIKARLSLPSDGCGRKLALPPDEVELSTKESLVDIKKRLDYAFMFRAKSSSIEECLRDKKEVFKNKSGEHDCNKLALKRRETEAEIEKANESSDAIYRNSNEHNYSDKWAKDKTTASYRNDHEKFSENQTRQNSQEKVVVHQYSAPADLKDQVLYGNHTIPQIIFPTEFQTNRENNSPSASALLSNSVAQSNCQKQNLNVAPAPNQSDMFQNIKHNEVPSIVIVVDRNCAENQNHLSPTLQTNNTVKMKPKWGKEDDMACDNITLSQIDDELVKSRDSKTNTMFCDTEIVALSSKHPHVTRQTCCEHSICPVCQGQCVNKQNHSHRSTVQIAGNINSNSNNSNIAAEPSEKGHICYSMRSLFRRKRISSLEQTFREVNVLNKKCRSSSCLLLPKRIWLAGYNKKHTHSDPDFQQRQNLDVVNSDIQFRNFSCKNSGVTFTPRDSTDHRGAFKQRCFQGINPGPYFLERVSDLSRPCLKFLCSDSDDLACCETECDHHTTTNKIFYKNRDMKNNPLSYMGTTCVFQHGVHSISHLDNCSKENKNVLVDDDDDDYGDDDDVTTALLNDSKKHRWRSLQNISECDMSKIPSMYSSKNLKAQSCTCIDRSIREPGVGSVDNKVMKAKHNHLLKRLCTLPFSVSENPACRGKDSQDAKTPLLLSDVPKRTKFSYNKNRILKKSLNKQTEKAQYGNSELQFAKIKSHLFSSAPQQIGSTAFKNNAHKQKYTGQNSDEWVRMNSANGKQETLADEAKGRANKVNYTHYCKCYEESEHSFTRSAFLESHANSSDHEGRGPDELPSLHGSPDRTQCMEQNQPHRSLNNLTGDLKMCSTTCVPTEALGDRLLMDKCICGSWRRNTQGIGSYITQRVDNDQIPSPIQEFHQDRDKSSKTGHDLTHHQIMENHQELKRPEVSDKVAAVKNMDNPSKLRRQGKSENDVQPRNYYSDIKSFYYASPTLTNCHIDTASYIGDVHNKPMILGKKHQILQDTNSSSVYPSSPVIHQCGKSHLASDKLSKFGCCIFSNLLGFPSNESTRGLAVSKDLCFDCGKQKTCKSDNCSQNQISYTTNNYNSFSPISFHNSSSAYLATETDSTSKHKQTLDLDSKTQASCSEDEASVLREKPECNKASTDCINQGQEINSPPNFCSQCIPSKLCVDNECQLFCSNRTFCTEADHVHSGKDINHDCINLLPDTKLAFDMSSTPRHGNDCERLDSNHRSNMKEVRTDFSDIHYTVTIFESYICDKCLLSSLIDLLPVKRLYVIKEIVDVIITTQLTQLVEANLSVPGDTVRCHIPYRRNLDYHIAERLSQCILDKTTSTIFSASLLYSSSDYSPSSLTHDLICSVYNQTSSHCEPMVTSITNSPVDCFSLLLYLIPFDLRNYFLNSELCDMNLPVAGSDDHSAPLAECIDINASLTGAGIIWEPSRASSFSTYIPDYNLYTRFCHCKLFWYAFVCQNFGNYVCPFCLKPVDVFGFQAFLKLSSHSRVLIKSENCISDKWLLGFKSDYDSQKSIETKGLPNPEYFPRDDKDCNSVVFCREFQPVFQDSDNSDHALKVNKFVNPAQKLCQIHGQCALECVNTRSACDIAVKEIITSNTVSETNKDNYTYDCHVGDSPIHENCCPQLECQETDSETTDSFAGLSDTCLETKSVYKIEIDPIWQLPPDIVNEKTFNQKHLMEDFADEYVDSEREIREVNMKDIIILPSPSILRDSRSEQSIEIQGLITDETMSSSESVSAEENVCVNHISGGNSYQCNCLEQSMLTSTSYLLRPHDRIKQFKLASSNIVNHALHSLVPLAIGSNKPPLDRGGCDTSTSTPEALTASAANNQNGATKNTYASRDRVQPDSPANTRSDNNANMATIETTKVIHSTLLGCVPTFQVDDFENKSSLSGMNVPQSDTCEFFVRTVFDSLFASNSYPFKSDPCLSTSDIDYTNSELLEFPLSTVFCKSFKDTEQSSEKQTDSSVFDIADRNRQKLNSAFDVYETRVRQYRSPQRNSSAQSWFSLDDLSGKPSSRHASMVFLNSLRRQLNSVLSPNSIRHFFGVNDPQENKKSTRGAPFSRDTLTTNQINVIITRCESLVLDKRQEMGLPPIRDRAATLDPSSLDKSSRSSSDMVHCSMTTRQISETAAKPRTSSLDTSYSSNTHSDDPSLIGRSQDLSIGRSRGASLDLLSPASASYRTGSMCSGISSLSKLTECSAYTEHSRSDCEKITRRTAEREHNITKLLGVITLMFVISWSVSWSIILIDNLTIVPVTDMLTTNVTLSIARNLFLVNHFCNILVYVILSKSFRERLSQCYKSWFSCFTF